MRNLPERIINRVSTHSHAEAAATTSGGAGLNTLVSTHSHAEAAASLKNSSQTAPQSFNTQPRGGGCSLPKKARKISKLTTVFR